MNNKCLQLIENYKKFLEKKGEFDLVKIDKDNIKNIKDFIDNISRIVNILKNIMKPPLMSLFELKELKHKSDFDYDKSFPNCSFFDDVDNVSGMYGDKNPLIIRVKHYLEVNYNYESDKDLHESFGRLNMEFPNGVSDIIKYLSFHGYDFSSMTDPNILFDFIRQIRPVGLGLSSDNFGSVIYKSFDEFIDMVIDLEIKSLDIGQFNFFEKFGITGFVGLKKFHKFFRFLEESQIEDLNLFRCSIGELFGAQGCIFDFFRAISGSRIQILSLDNNKLGDYISSLDYWEIIFRDIAKSNVVELDLVANGLYNIINNEQDFEKFLGFINKTKLKKVFLLGNMLEQYYRKPNIQKIIEKMNCKIIVDE